VQNPVRQISRVTNETDANLYQHRNIYGSGSDKTRVANMDVSMTDRPQEAIPLLEEDRLRLIARHVKDYIPGNGDGDIDEQKL